MPNTERLCFIHAGTHKTGTTSIQAFLADNREALELRGVFIPRSAGNGDPRFACHHQIVRELVGSEEFNGALGGLDAVLEELRRTKARIACISSEDFSLIYNREDLLISLRDRIIASGFAPRLVMYLRPQVSYSVAVYATNVSSGFRVAFDRYVDDMLEHGSYFWNGGFGPPLDYNRLLELFTVVFHRNAIIVKRFRSDVGDAVLLLSFLRLLLPQTSNLHDLRVSSQRANRTLTFTTVLDLLGKNDGISSQFRFSPMTITDLRRFEQRFHRANKKLLDSYGVRLPVSETIDLLRALPLRRGLRATCNLIHARRLIRG